MEVLHPRAEECPLSDVRTGTTVNSLLHPKISSRLKARLRFLEVCKVLGMLCPKLPDRLGYLLFDRKV